MLGKKDQAFRQTPGPGQYASKSFIELGHGHDFGKDPRIKNTLFKTPGPGDYSYEDALIKYKSK